MSPDRKPVVVTILGTGDAFANGGRSRSAYLIRAHGTLIALEAAPELLGSLKRAAISAAEIDLLLVSHMHGDHFGGLPFLFLEYLYENPRIRPLTIAGPAGLERRTWRLMRTMYPRAQTDKLKSKLRWKALKPDSSVRLGRVRVDVIRSPHTKPDVSLSLRIRTGGRTVVFSGDTGWNEDLVSFSAGADLLLCECSFFKACPSSFHLSYQEISANRGRFKVGRMLLTHLGSEVLARRSEVQVEMAFDGMEIGL